MANNISTLTPCENRIFLMIVERGMRDREIANETGFTFGSVKTIIHRILQKKEATSRAQLIVMHWKRKVA